MPSKYYLPYCFVFEILVYTCYLIQFLIFLSTSIWHEDEKVLGASSNDHQKTSLSNQNHFVQIIFQNIYLGNHVKKNWVFIFSFKLMSSYFSIPIPPKNITKPEVFWYFQGYRNERKTWNGLQPGGFPYWRKINFSETS